MKMPMHIKVLRWIAVLPGAIVAAVLSLIPLHLILYIVLMRFVEVYPEMPERILGPALLSGVFVWAGSRISPVFKFETAVVLFGLWMFLVGGLVFLAWSGSDVDGRQLYFQGGGLPTVMAIVGAAIGLFAARMDQQEESNGNG